MYTPAYSRIEEVEQIHAFVREYGFATLVTCGSSGLAATHVPLLLDSERGVLRGHMARANPQWRDLVGNEVMAIFHGPHAYVSPAWYASAASVPTWNYSAVHAYGTAALIEDEAALTTLLAQSVELYEGQRPEPWSMDAAEGIVAGLLHGIVGFELTVTRWEGKEKMSQNRSEVDRVRVVAGLLREGRHAEAEVARRMQELQAGGVQCR